MRDAAVGCVGAETAAGRRSRNREQKRGLGARGWAAAAVGAAAAICALGCIASEPAEPVSYAEAAPSAEEQYCAWFGDARSGVLYFGEAPFWWALRKEDDPRADLALPGPQRIGRFDLRRRKLLPALDLGGGGSPAGTWDVLAHPNGRVYFTDFFGTSGSVDPASGTVARFDALGSGLNELALGPDGELLATRYGSDRGKDGSLVVFDPDGTLLAEHPLAPPDGYHVAPKSVAWDPVRREIWLNTDLLPAAPGRPVRHDARVLAEDGAERLRFEAPEVQFMAFSDDGTGWFAEAHGSELRLRVRPPERAASALLTGRIVPLDDAFHAGADFVQDIHPGPDGSEAVVTRWSGKLHVVGSDGSRRDVALPVRDGDLYYSGVRAGGAVCATRCGTVEVVCRGVGDSLF